MTSCDQGIRSVVDASIWSFGAHLPVTILAFAVTLVGLDAAVTRSARTWNERFLNILNSEIGDPWGPIATTCPCVVMRRGPFPKPYLDELSFFQPGESKMNGESVWNGETIM